MDTKYLCKHLTKLIKLDIDAVRAYNQALEHIDYSEIHAKISSFREDHQRHITDLKSAILAMGEEPPNDSPDLKGFFIEGFTAIRSVTGIEGALKAMRGNEKLTNSTYENALTWELPTEVRTIIERNYADEKRHLAYIENVLTTKPWVHSESATF